MKITKSELRQRCIDNETAIATLETLLKEHGIARKQEPKLKQLDQSVFDGLDEKWRFAARCLSGKAIATESEPRIILNGYYCEGGYLLIGEGYDTSNWQNSLIERDLAKELLEVDLSGELTGSDLTRSILSKQFMQACLVSDSSDKAARQGDDLQLIRMYNESEGKFISMRDPWHGCHHKYAVAVDNNRKPLTAADLGL